MSGKDVTTELPVEIGDPLAAKIRDSIFLWRQIPRVRYAFGSMLAEWLHFR